MKSQFLEQVKLIKDASTTGVDRTGFMSALVIVHGGTDDKDVKLQTGTAAGSTSDYLTLGKSTGAGTTVAFFADLTGCDKYIKVTGTSLTSTEIVLGDPVTAPADTTKVYR